MEPPMFKTFLNDDFFSPMRNLDHLFGSRSLRPWGLSPRRLAFPLVNVYTGDNELLVTAEVPGVSAEELEVQVEGNLLTLSGNRPGASAEEGEHLLRQERGSGRFTKAIQLPFRVDPEEVKAVLRHGVLELRLQRPNEDRPRKISVEVVH
jgi:HSP20 family protein